MLQLNVITVMAKILTYLTFCRFRNLSKKSQKLDGENDTDP